MTQIQQGSDDWKDLRNKCIEPVPGKFSALYFLNSKILGHEEMGEFVMTPEMHYALCLFAERATGIPEIDNARIRLIQVPRGTGKTTLVTKGRAIQELLKFDDWAIGIANETSGMAKRFLASIKEEFESNDLLQALFPKKVPNDPANDRERTWAAEEIVIDRERPRPAAPSVLSTGAGATVTGVHMDHWIVDDLISEDLAENAIRGHTTEMEKMQRWVVRLEPLLASRTRSPITFIGTPWFAGDTYEFIERYWGQVEDGVPLDEAPKDFETVWTLRLPDGTKQRQRLYRRGELAVFRKPAYNERGESAFPEIWSTEELDDIRSRPETAEFFAANYLLEPTAGLATTFDDEWLQLYELDAGGNYINFWDQTGNRHSERVKDLVTWIAIDPAFSSKSSAARTAIVVIGTNGKELFLLEDHAEHGMTTTDIATVAGNFAYKYRPVKVFLETIATQAGLVEPIQKQCEEMRVGRLPLKELPSHSDRNKEIRIRNLEPWFSRGLFHVHKSHRNFRQEYGTFPRGQLRDVLDATSFMREDWEKSIGGEGRRSQSRDDWKAAEDEKIHDMMRSLGPGGGY